MPNLASNLTKRIYRWTEWKQVYANKNFAFQYEESVDKYFIWGYDGPEVHLCEIWKSVVPDAAVSGSYTQIQNDTDKIDFETNYKSKGNEPINSKSSDRSFIVDVSLRKGAPGTDSLTIVTHDFSDRTSWYQNSVKVIDGTLTDIGNGLTFQAAVGVRNWINIDSPKLTYDHNKLLLRDGTFGKEEEYRVIVKVNNIIADKSTYTINFIDGSITFSTTKAGSIVTATYYHNDGIANRSDFLINPPVGQMFRIEHVEIQFSRYLQFPTQVTLEMWAGGTLATYGDFNDTLYNAGYGQQRSVYRGHRDLINWCNNQYPVIPACGDLTQDILVFPFKFLVAVDMKSSQGTMFRVHTVNDIPLTGELSTATLYMESMPL